MQQAKGAGSTTTRRPRTLTYFSTGVSRHGQYNHRGSEVGRRGWSEHGRQGYRRRAIWHQRHGVPTDHTLVVAWGGADGDFTAAEQEGRPARRTGVGPPWGAERLRGHRDLNWWGEARKRQCADGPQGRSVVA